MFFDLTAWDRPLELLQEKKFESITRNAERAECNWRQSKIYICIFFYFIYTHTHIYKDSRGKVEYILAKELESDPR